MLFDTGTAHAVGAGIVPSLNALGIRRLDKLVLSHHDIDHDGGYTAVERAQPPEKLLAGQPEFYPQAEFCDESQWVWNGVVFEFLRPSEAHSGKDDNDESCVLRVVADGQALLLTGDMGRRAKSIWYKNTVMRSTAKYWFWGITAVIRPARACF
nr:MBL fold metallo-hydrolase [Neisseria weixii]